MTTSPINPQVSLRTDPGPVKRPASLRVKRQILAVVFSYFLVAGVATVMLGPTLPLLAERWRLPDAQLGTLFFAYFAGQLSGAWFSTWRLGVSLLLGAAGSAAGLCALAFARATGAHLLLFLIGAGIGAGLTAGNVLVGTIDDVPVDSHGNSTKEKSVNASRSRMLALLNLSWGLGAITCPLWLRLSASLGHLAGNRFVADPAAKDCTVFFIGLGFALAGIAAFIGWLLPQSLYRRTEAGEGRPSASRRILWLFLATLALYVGVENALAGWLPTYAQRLAATGALSGRAAEIALCFWVAELAGRACTAAIIRRTDERIFYRVCVMVVIAAIGLLVIAPRLGEDWIFALTAVSALSLSPVFPLAVSWLLARAGSDSRRDPRIGKIFASASFGGCLLPWLTGAGSAKFQSLRLGFVVPWIGAVLILLLSFLLPRSAESLKVSDK